MGKALYRIYRSRSFDEVVGQDHITSTLAKAVKNGRISHAYLFTGPRGVGKTSVARILAHEVNLLPYSGEETHLDIIEIDAASNRRIDEIRELRDRVHAAPASAKYKVYIIDEVHMLTREAFNALLKTLEEPPAHTLFILATTEAHKLPATIISRTQRFNFQAVAPAQIAEHLAAIAKKEKIQIDDGALLLLAEYGEGSVRDSISLLDQLTSSVGKITTGSVRRHLALPPEEAIIELLAAVKNGDAAAVLATLEKMKSQGSDAPTLAKFLAAGLRRALLNGQTEAASLKLLRDLLEVPASPMPAESLEIALLDSVQTGGPAKPYNEAAGKKEPAKPLTPLKKASPNQERQDQSAFSLDEWPRILDAIRTESPSVFSALKQGVPRLDDDKLVLYFEFELHRNKIAQAKHIDLISRVIETITNHKKAVTCQVDKAVVRANKGLDLYKPAVEENDPHLQTINNIFGTAEMLES
jgi:DNA polymerase III subunit gamma/tau